MNIRLLKGGRGKFRASHYRNAANEDAAFVDKHAEEVIKIRKREHNKPASLKPSVTGVKAFKR